MGKRSNGEGTVFKTADGKWKAVISVGRSMDGKRRRRTKVAKTKADAVALLRQMQNELAEGIVSLSRHPTISEFLESWLTDIVAPSRGKNTEALYRNACEIHIAPQVGGVRLDALNALHIQAMLSTWRKTDVGGRTQQVGLSVLSRACKAAVGMGLIRVNPCQYVEPPSVERKKIDPFTADEAMRILKAAEPDPLYAALVLMFTAGIRFGEMAGLTTKCVDLKTETIRIEQQVTTVKGRATVGPPKTKRSQRVIELTPLGVAALGNHLKLNLRLGKAGSEFVFTGARGALLNRNNFRQRTWHPILDAAGVRLRSPHSARHTFATLSLAAGTPVHVVSAILGHARASITLDTYAHFVPTQQAAARDAIARLLG